MNELQIFKNEEFGEIRIVDLNGEPWFVGKDIAEILGYERESKAIVDRVDEDDRTMISSETQSQIGIELGQRGGWVINESGLYSLILSSKLPTAKKFKKWVTSEVLPTIRKTGGYVNNDDLFISNYLPNADEQTKIMFKTMTAVINNLNERIDKDKPLVEFANKVTKSCDNILMRDMAKLLCDEHIDIGEKRLYNLLRDKKVLMTDNSPYQDYIGRGYFVVKETTYKTPFGDKLSKTTLVTPKGQLWLVSKVAEWK